MKTLQTTSPPEILFFDVNETLLDMSPVKKSVAAALQGADHLVPLWFSTLLHHSLVTTVGDEYTDFGSIGVASLQMVAANQGLRLSETEAREALGPMKSLSPYPEVKPALERLKQAGYKMVALTNSSSEGVAAQMENAGLTTLFDQVISVEGIGKYKPHSEVYAWSARQTGATNCLMVAAHGWDVAGALWAGWRAAFVARPGQQLYPLAPIPEINAPDLQKVADQLLVMKQEKL